MRWLLVAALVSCKRESPPKPPPPSPSAAPPVVDAMAIDAPPDAKIKIECTAKAIADARKQADAFVKEGKYDDAIALLDGEGCYLDEDQPEALKSQIAWRISDLSFAYYKAGKFGECYSYAAGETAPYAGNVGHFFGDEDRVMTALDTNAKLCQAAEDKARGAFTPSTKCSLIPDAFGIPLGVIADTACIEIGEAKKDADDMNACGQITLHRKTGKQVTSTVLHVDGGNLDEGSVCCNLQSMAFQKRATGFALLAITNGRDCNGGTASSEEQHVYELHGDKLEMTRGFGATFH